MTTLPKWLVADCFPWETNTETETSVQDIDQGVLLGISTERMGSRIGQKEKLSSDAIPRKISANPQRDLELGQRCIFPMLVQEDQDFTPTL